MVAARRFTLLNVVVVLLVVCFGLVLFMYYVARQRWAAQQQATTTRMVLLYQAIDQFETAQGVYPGYRVTQAIDGTGNPVPASWAFAILPYLDNPEAQAIHQQYGSQGPEATRGQKPDLRLADFIAPGVSRPGPILSFVVNAALPDGRATPTIPADWPANGIFQDAFPKQVDGELVARSEVSEAFVQSHDGLDATLLLAENVDAGNWTDIHEPQVGFVWLPTLDPPAVARINGKAEGQVSDPYLLARPCSRFPKTAPVLFASGRYTYMAAQIDYLVYMRLMCAADDLAAPAGADADYELPEALTSLPMGPAPNFSPLDGQ